MFLYKEAIKNFRIPQYGFEERLQNKDIELWRIGKPQLINNSHIVYTIEGVDNMGPFDGNRRYNHFHALWNTLS